MFTNPSRTICRIQTGTVALLIFSIMGCRATQPNLNSVDRSDVTPTVEKTPESEFAVQQVAFVESIGPQDSQANLSIHQGNDGSKNLVEVTLEDIQNLAFTSNPTIQKIEAEICALKGRHLQVGLLPNPTAGVFGNEINDAGNAGRYGVYYSQKVVRSNRLGLARQVVCAEIEAKEIELAEMQQRLTTDVRLRFYDLLVANAQYEVANQLYQISENGVKATRQLVDAKEAAATSLAQSEIEFQKAALNLKRVNNQVSAAQKGLAALLNESELPFKELDGSLEDVDSSFDIEEQFEKLIEQSPEMVRMYAEVDVARRNHQHQCSLRIPDLNYQAGLAYDFASDEVIPNFQIGLPIMRNNCNQGAIAEARHQIAFRERALEQKVLEIRQRLVETFRVYMDAKIQVEAFREEIMPKARETLQLLSLGYKQGEVGFLELLTAQRTFFQINLEYVQQLQLFWRQKILMEGMLLEDNLGQFESGD